MMSISSLFPAVIRLESLLRNAVSTQITPAQCGHFHFWSLMNQYVTVLVRNGQYTGAVVDALLRCGFELIERTVTHGGRELLLKAPPDHK